MANELHYPFTPEQITGQAQGNAAVAILGAIAYTKSLGQDPRAFAQFVGQRVAGSWAGIAGPREAATAIALNCASLGMTVVSVGGDDTRAGVVTGDWPGTEGLQMLGVTQADADAAWEIFTPIAQSLGYSYSFQRDGAQLHFTIAR